MKEVVNECGGGGRRVSLSLVVVRGRSRVSERLLQPGVDAQRQVGQARETILHVSLPANQSRARRCMNVLHASSVTSFAQLLDYISRVTSNMC